MEALAWLAQGPGPDTESVRFLTEVTTGDYYDGVKVVGIKLLKARLSEYVRLARAGEIILVSDRDEVVAELGPPRRQPQDPESLDAVLDQLVDRGWLTRASEPKSKLRLPLPSLGMSPEAVDELLDDLRADRF
jgi:antitoxin (DNA-binding transcriptional repressor) of toxin-antitoxin stability system